MTDWQRFNLKTRLTKANRITTNIWVDRKFKEANTNLADQTDGDFQLLREILQFRSFYNRILQIVRGYTVVISVTLTNQTVFTFNIYNNNQWQFFQTKFIYNKELMHNYFIENVFTCVYTIPHFFSNAVVSFAHVSAADRGYELIATVLSVYPTFTFNSKKIHI